MASPNLQEFLKLSTALTGFTEFTLTATGYAEIYLATVTEIVGDGTVAELLAAFASARSAGGNNVDALNDCLRSELLAHEKLGPVARNIIKLWYVSTWFELPNAWSDKFGPLVNDRTIIVAPFAYPEGLLWSAVGSHPPGAKAPGYASWIHPPSIDISS